MINNLFNYLLNLLFNLYFKLDMYKKLCENIYKLRFILKLKWDALYTANFLNFFEVLVNQMSFYRKQNGGYNILLQQILKIKKEIQFPIPLLQVP